MQKNSVKIRLAEKSDSEQRSDFLDFCYHYDSNPFV